MRPRNEDVFFFTLIDFLLQVFFFGLMLYVLAEIGQRENLQSLRKDAEDIENLKLVSGVSNITTLTEELKKLGPMEDLKGSAEFIQMAGGLDNLKRSIDVVAMAGGPAALQERLEKLKGLEEGLGKPPCLYEIRNGRKIPTPVAVVVATDTHIRFEQRFSALDEPLNLVQRNFESVRELSHSQFRELFTQLVKSKPECRYMLEFHEDTRYVDGRDAARGLFHLNIKR